jgi:hypothetical protein
MATGSSSKYVFLRPSSSAFLVCVVPLVGQMPVMALHWSSQVVCSAVTWDLDSSGICSSQRCRWLAALKIHESLSGMLTLLGKYCGSRSDSYSILSS